MRQRRGWNFGIGDAAMKSIAQVLRWVDSAGPYEVLSLALQMEQGAVRCYTAMATAARRRLTKAKFRYLAEEEREHARLVAQSRKNLERPAKTRKIPPSLSEVRGTADGSNPEAAVRLAIRAEQESEALYKRCAERCSGEAIRQLFTRMAEQESRHATALKDELGELRGEFSWRSIEGTPPAEEHFWA